jgi:PTH1 family peptidyl-tRNA hydrolase
MKAIIGLGNPEPPYAGTRHNAGAEVAAQAREFLELGDWQLQTKVQVYLSKNSEYLVGKPSLFMNESGLAVRSVLDYYQILPEHLFLVFDDLDLPVGSYKVQFAKGPKDHNGLLSVYQHLGTRNFWHVRIGVDGRSDNQNIDPSTYVLERFLGAEQAAMKQVIVQVLPELKRRLAATDIALGNS